MTTAKSLLQQQNYAHQSWWGEYLAQYRLMAESVRGHHVLDLGCAFGYGSRYLFDSGANFVLGVDFDPGRIRGAQENWGRDGVSFMCHDGNQDLHRPDFFDVATCFRVLEASRNPDAMVGQLHRALKPGGKLFISTTNRVVKSQLQETPIFQHHLQEFDAVEFEQILRLEFPSVEIFGMFCVRSQLNVPVGRPLVDFFKSKAETLMPWQIRERISEALLGQTYFPSENEFILRKQNLIGAQVLYAICRKD